MVYGFVKNNFRCLLKHQLQKTRPVFWQRKKIKLLLKKYQQFSTNWKLSLSIFSKNLQVLMF